MVSPIGLTTGLGDFSTNRHEYCGLGYSPVLHTPRLKHNQDSERITSDEDAIGTMSGASRGMRVAIVFLRNSQVPDFIYS